MSPINKAQLSLRHRQQISIKTKTRLSLTNRFCPAMTVLLSYSTTARFAAPRHHRRPLRQCVFSVRSSLSLPFTEEKAKYCQHLKAAVDVVVRACRLCVDVQKSLFSSDGNIVEKLDQTPVTVADFGVQALVSLEMGKLFPLIPLVAEEDSLFVRENNLVGDVFQACSDKSTIRDELCQEDVLRAIDRGGKDAYLFGPDPATYWILDPIDGTRGFVKGSGALYVIGLALVVEGKIVLGVMGCPNWEEDDDSGSKSGTVMISHIGCGTWRTKLWNKQTGYDGFPQNWIRCSVDGFHQVREARYCIPESHTWDSLPLSTQFSATTHSNRVGDEVLLLPTCCGSLCKYLMVASGKASVFIVGTKTTKTKIIRAWDHAVGVICVHEAGGKVTDWNGNELNFAEDEAERRAIFPSGGILATNNRLHDQILYIISSS